MDLFGTFRRIFGADRRLPPAQEPTQSVDDRDEDNYTDRQDFPDAFTPFESDDPYGGSDWGRDFFGFNVFTNPLEMHRYFEQQMDEFMKQFGMMRPSAVPDSEPGSIRDRMLKTPDTPGDSMGYVEDTDKQDVDLDGRIQELFPKPQHEQPLIKSFHNSIRIQRIQLPDGTVEERRTVRDSTGKEETTVTRSRGDQSHSLTLKKDSTGQPESVEDFVNIEHPSDLPLQGNLEDWSFFRNFFKFK